MKFELPKLHYSVDSLAPFISAETLEFHYQRHHRAYIEKLNQLVLGTSFIETSLEEIIQQSSGALFNNAAQTWNHTFYWNSLSPLNAHSTPPQNQNESRAFMSQIKADFGSVDELKRCIKECGLSAFGSAWIWLAKDKFGHLRVISTHDAENPMRIGMTPVLTCDVWEHAYYIDYRNERGKYLDAFLELLNLDFANQCFTHGRLGNQVNPTLAKKKQAFENGSTSYIG